MILAHFPAQYKPNDSQVEIAPRLDEFLKTDKKFCIIQASTGAGKSMIAKMLANHSNRISPEKQAMIRNYSAYEEKNADLFIDNPNEGAFILTLTKTLQNQYQNTLPDLSIFKGKTAYMCAVEPRSTVQSAPCTILPKMIGECISCNKCPYYNARNNALSNSETVLNYHSFDKLMPWLKHRQYMICDEASELEDVVVAMHSTEIDIKRLTKYGCNIRSLPKADRERRNWVNTVRNEIETILDAAQKSTGNKKQDAATKKKIDYLTELKYAIAAILNTYELTEYVFQEAFNGSIIIEPLRVDGLAQEALYQYAERVFLVSATIVDPIKYAKDLGIAESELFIINIESKFDPNKGKIYVSKDMKLNHKNLDENLPKLTERIKLILNRKKNVRGAIHTSTNKITKYIQDNLGEPRCIYREAGVATNEDLLEIHGDNPDSVIVSPSITFGTDLKDDAARFQIIAKISYPSLQSERIKRLFEIDKEWYTNKTLASLIQTCGRIIRNENDYGDTFILDASAVYLITSNAHKLPKYFIDRIH